ncbi:heat shock protein [Colletotrichum truncatum]|uniref:Heat shock protein n=1 Tax=Colletotrichum truncatum TaxID=5467 RepID=A0ACC3YWS5_COLTU|nr:heat shock protein [Colletotrichum truncatum]KAF6787562.1 heat shock protein [Colletotrichum truncatum]
MSRWLPHRGNPRLDFLSTLALLICVLHSARAECTDSPADLVYGINIGPSVSSVGLVGRGIIRVPTENQNWIYFPQQTYHSHGINHTQTIEVPEFFLSGQEPTLQNALFNTSHMICHKDEPEYFIQRVVHNPSSYRSSNDDFLSNDTLKTLFRQMQDIAEGWFGEAADMAIVSTPYNWREDSSLETIRAAGRAVGLRIPRFTSAPSSATIGHGLDGVLWDDEYLLIFDLGRNNFEITVLQTEDGVIDVFSSSRDSVLGREIGAFHQRRVGERIRAREELHQETIHHIESVLAAANITKETISHVVLSGEHTRHPLVKSLLDGFFNTNPAPVHYHVLDERDEAVTLGVALQAWLLALPDCAEAQYIEIMPRAISIAGVGGQQIEIVPKYNIIPYRGTLNLTTATDNQTFASIPVALGGFKISERNDHLTTLKLEGISPARCGEPTITLEVTVDRNNSQDFILKVEATLLNADGTAMLKDSVFIGDWWRFEEPALTQVLEEEIAVAEFFNDTCPNEPSCNSEFDAAVAVKLFDDLDEFSMTLRAKEEKAAGRYARALCFYEKSLPYFPIGHPELLKEIKTLGKQVKTETDYSIISRDYLTYFRHPYSIFYTCEFEL